MQYFPVHYVIDVGLQKIIEKKDASKGCRSEQYSGYYTILDTWVKEWGSQVGEGLLWQRIAS